METTNQTKKLILVCPTCKERYPAGSYCRPCSERNRIKKYNAMEEKEWDGTTPVYSDFADEIFYDNDELENYCEEHDITPESLQLIICQPVYARTIEDWYWEGDLPMDMSLDDTNPGLGKKLDELNRYIMEEKPILSYKPSKFRVKK